jgi:uncharacterized protein (DUF2235 family)
MKNIVICCDGTDNEISEKVSNVLKLYRMMRKSGKTEPHQMVFDDPGAGTLARPVSAQPVPAFLARLCGYYFFNMASRA